MKKLMGLFSVAVLCLAQAGCGEPASSTAAPGEAPAAPPTGEMAGAREAGVAGHGAHVHDRAGAGGGVGVEHFDVCAEGEGGVAHGCGGGDLA